MGRSVSRKMLVLVEMAKDEENCFGVSLELDGSSTSDQLVFWHCILNNTKL